MSYLAARLHEFHQGPMKGLDIESDQIATGGADGAVRVMAINGAHLGTSRAHSDMVNAVAINPAGKVVSGSRDRTVRLFNPIVGRTYVVGEHDHWVMSVAWSESGDQIVSGSEDGTLRVWEPEGASVTRVALGSPVNGVSWGGDHIAAVTGDGRLHVLTPDGAVRNVLSGAQQIPWAVALSPDGSRVAWTGRDRWLRIADIDGDDHLAVAAHHSQVWSVTWDEAGERLVTGSADGTVAIWSGTGEALERIPVPEWVRRAAFRGVELYIATEEGNLRIFSSYGGPARVPEPIDIPVAPASCSHWDPQVEDAGFRPRCAECGSMEEPRLCVTCGHIGCCESQLAHGTKHWLETGHPNTVPAVAGAFVWRWCYVDDMYVKQTG